MLLVLALFDVFHLVVAEVEKLSDSENLYPGEHIQFPEFFCIAIFAANLREIFEV